MRPIIHIDPAKTDPNYGKQANGRGTVKAHIPPMYSAANLRDRTIPAYRSVRRGRPRDPQVVSFQAPGDMAHILTRLASHANVSTSEIVRRILTVALETPDVWLTDLGE